MTKSQIPMTNAEKSSGRIFGKKGKAAAISHWSLGFGHFFSLPANQALKRL